MKKLLYSAMALIALGGCSEDQDLVSVMRGKEVRLCSSIATRTVGDQWESGDQIGVYMTSPDGDKSNILYTTDESGVLTTTNKLYYPAEGTIDLMAYYPYVAELASAERYPVSVVNQKDLGAIDLLSATAEAQVRGDEAVELAFDHRLSRVAITIAKSDQITDDDIEGMTVVLSGTQATATYNLTTDEVTPTGVATDIALTLSEMSVEAIVIPQQFSGAKFLFGGTAYDTMEAAIATTEFVSGMSYTYTATLQGTEVILGNPTIEPWITNDAGDLSGYINEDGADIKLNNGIYEIYSGRGLKAFADLVNGEINTSGATTEGGIAFERGYPKNRINAHLMADVSVAGAGEWVPIGGRSSYIGVFDGKGHMVKGITMSPNEEVYRMGLFGTIGEGGYILNLGVSGRIYGGEDIGGVVGKNEYGVVLNCYSVAEVRGKRDVGGVVGSNYGFVSACYGAGVVEASDSSSGGVIGCNCPEEGAVVSYCYSDRDVSGPNTIANAGETPTPDCAAYSTATMQSKVLAKNLNRGASLLQDRDDLYSWEIINDNNYPTQIPGRPMASYDLEKLGETYYIYSGRGLRAFSDLVNGEENTTNAYTIGDIEFTKEEQPTLKAKLRANVSLGGIEWNPIGDNNDNNYTGTFDGDGYFVDDLYISGSDYTGLFGVVGSGGVVKNLGVGGDIVDGGETAGGIAASNKGVVVNCYSSVHVKSNLIAGGVVGYNTGIVTACYGSGAVSCSGDKGGVVGYNDGSNSTVSYCYNDSEKSGTELIVGKGTKPTNSASYTTAQMQSPSTASKLTEGAYYYKLGTGEKLYAWKFTDCEYSTIDSEKEPTAPCDLELKDSKYYIYTGKGLRAFADLVNGKVNTSDAAVEGGIKFTYGTPQNDINGQLIDDVSLKGTWDAIKDYEGTFDGDGHVVSGLAIFNNDDDQGLFGSVSPDGTIKNLGVSGSVKGKNNVGGVAGANNGTIVNCYSSVTVTATGGAVGGVVGSNTRKVTACYSTGAVSGTANTGGVVGENNGTVSYCYYDNTECSQTEVVGNKTSTQSGGYNTTTMKSEWLVSQLQIGASEYIKLDPANSARTWQHTEGNYPTISSAAQKPLTIDMEYSNNTCLINTAKGLQAFAELVNDNKITSDAVVAGYIDPEASYQGVNAELMKNVTVTGWTPIESCNGTFDGGGYTINITITGSNDHQGLFKSVGSGGVVKNLGVSGSISGDDYVGGIAVSNFGTILNCYSSVAVTGSRYVGGIAGVNYYTGGIAACYATGKVDCNGTSGGVVGYNNSGSVGYCYYDKETTGKSRSVGEQEGIAIDLYGYTTAQMKSDMLLKELNMEAADYNEVHEAGLYGWSQTSGNYPTIDRNVAPTEPRITDIVKNGDTYEIYTGRGLSQLALNADAKLMNDIILPEFWTPIGYGGYSYTGTFDGDGYVVRGLMIDGDSDNQGLFGVVVSGVVKNLGVEGSVSGGNNIGGVVGNNFGTVVNCYSSVAVTGSSYVGGVVGYNNNTVTACYAIGKVTGTTSTGGVVGQNNNTVSYCYFNTETTGQSNATSNGTPENCAGYTTAEMQSTTLTTWLNAGAWLYNETTTADVWAWKANTDNYPTIDRNVAPTEPVVDLERDENSICQIYTAKGLQAFADLVNGRANTSGAFCVGGVSFGSAQTSINGALTKTIELDNTKQWTPIGSYGGTFDGKGHTVSNITINNSTGTNQGLFGSVGSDGVVKNLGVSGSITGATTIGGVVGQNFGTVVNCYSSVTLEGTNNIGGVVGDNYSTGTVTACYAIGKVGGSAITGGVVGENGGKVSYCYHDSSATGKLKAVGINTSDTATNTSGYTATQMKTTEFETLLNAGAYYYDNDGTIGWVFRGSYPVLATGTLTAPEVDIVRNGNTYTINTAKGLRSFAGLVNGEGNTGFAVGAVDFEVEAQSGINGQLAKDVTLSGEWTPISSYIGTFDGLGHTVSNLKISSGNDQGLFGVVFWNGVVKNLGVVGVIDGGDTLGGVVGSNQAGGKVISCYSAVTVTATGGSAGGVVGYNGGTVTGCYSIKDVDGGDYVGGVVGYNGATVSNCYFDSDVCTVTNNAVVGGGGSTDSHAKSTTEMQSQATVTGLNNGIGNDSYKWKVSSGKYPTFQTNN